MTREEKNQMIADLTETLSSNDVVYLADISELDAEKSFRLRKLCHSRQVQLRVVKNTLLRKAMEQVEGREYGELVDTLKGNTSLLLSDTGNAPAKLIKEFRKKEDKPILKGAWVQESIYVGENQLEMLSELKSKNELIAEVIALLQSPAKNVLGALQSGGTTLSGLVKTLSERAE